MSIAATTEPAGIVSVSIVKNPVAANANGPDNGNRLRTEAGAAADRRDPPLPAAAQACQDLLQRWPTATAKRRG